MMRNTLMLLLLWAAFSSCSPSLSYFTQDLYDRNRWSESELKKIQFYLSDDVYLRRKLGENSSEIVEGKVRMINGEKVEEIFIPRSTPGVFTFSPKANRFAIALKMALINVFSCLAPIRKQVNGMCYWPKIGKELLARLPTMAKNTK